MSVLIGFPIGHGCVASIVSAIRRDEFWRLVLSDRTMPEGDMIAMLTLRLIFQGTLPSRTSSAFPGSMFQFDVVFAFRDSHVTVQIQTNPHLEWYGAQGATVTGASVPHGGEPGCTLQSIEAEMLEALGSALEMTLVPELTRVGSRGKPLLDARFEHIGGMFPPE